MGVSIWLTACGAASPATPTPLPTALPNQIDYQGASSAAGMQVVLVQSVISVGPNRFAIALLNGNNFLRGGDLIFTFYNLAQQTGNTLKAAMSLPAIYRDAPQSLAGIFTANVTFPSAGSWGLGVSGKGPDGKAIDQQVGFDVTASSAIPAVGQKAPPVQSPTLDSAGGDIKKLSSSPTPNPAFYQQSIASALGSGKPLVVQFSTPAFCTSRLCGPSYDVLNAVYPTYAERVNFIHVEVYQDLPNPDLQHPHYAPAMLAWGMTTEPWTYVIDQSGVVSWRAEGLITTDELKEQLARVAP
ncbi:MAG TPA: hypothetical protein VKQ72_13465 [Aggregatilineales bacterium]|nr:hypothetical protein [Aggregatilineales bacterium]